MAKHDNPAHLIIFLKSKTKALSAGHLLTISWVSLAY